VNGKTGDQQDVRKGTEKLNAESEVKSEKVRSAMGKWDKEEGERQGN